MPVLAVISVVGLIIWLILLPVKVICCPIGELLPESRLAQKFSCSASSDNLRHHETLISHWATVCLDRWVCIHRDLGAETPFCRADLHFCLQAVSYSSWPMLWRNCSRRLSKQFFGRLASPIRHHILRRRSLKHSIDS